MILFSELRDLLRGKTVLECESSGPHTTTFLSQGT